MDLSAMGKVGLGNGSSGKEGNKRSAVASAADEAGTKKARTSKYEPSRGYGASFAEASVDSKDAEHGATDGVLSKEESASKDVAKDSNSEREQPVVVIDLVQTQSYDTAETGDVENDEKNQVQTLGDAVAAMIPNRKFEEGKIEVSTAAAAKDEEEKDGQEIQILGSTGQNALTDFPHSREHCLVHPQAVDPALFCSNCFCYVCDKLVSDCPSWDSHCHAKYSDPKWRQSRASTTAASGSTSSATSIYRYYSVKELLESVTRIYPNEASPPQPVFATNLYHYQKQSLAFLLDIEKHQTGGQRVKSGWLCSEVGMGKSAVVIALVASNPMPVDEQPSLDDVKLASRTKGKRIKIKATVVFTSVSLLGQWEDEVHKHAPSLKVYRHHLASKMKVSDFYEADIIISTATFKWANIFTKSFEFHRVVVDESHLIGSVSARLEYVLDLETERSLCVTATPFTTSVSDLERQITFLMLDSEWNSLSSIEFLKRYMIRHMKSQIINGAEALILPKSTTTTKMVPMTYWERNTFHDALRNKGQRLQTKTRLLEMNWYAVLAQPMMCEDSSKIECLKEDLQGMLQSDPNMRVVVYTQFLEQQKYTKRAIQSMGIKTYNFNGSLQPHVRDRYIREFQSLEETGPAVFLVTIKAGSVGITLTAASHVFLLEPCIDPATEYQAAGRIHRLGQTKQVGVTKYVFEESCESRIVKLHELIEKGGITYTTGLLSAAALRILRLPHPPNASSEWLTQRSKVLKSALESELDRNLRREGLESFSPLFKSEPMAVAECSPLAKSESTVAAKCSPSTKSEPTVAAKCSPLAKTKLAKCPPLAKREPMIAAKCSSTSSSRTANPLSGCVDTCRNTTAKACTNNACATCCSAHGQLSCQRHKKKV